MTIYTVENFPVPVAVSGPWTIYRNAEGKTAAIPNDPNSGHSASGYGDMHHVERMLHEGQCEPYPKHPGQWALVEIKNPLHVHAVFSYYGTGRRFLLQTVPEYVRKGYYMDKTLTSADFTVVPYGKGVGA